MRATLDVRDAFDAERLRAAALTAAGAAVSFLAVTRMLRSGIAVLLLLGTALLAVLVLEKPRAVAALMLVFSAPLFGPMRWQFAIGGIRTDAFEILAYALVARWAISGARDRRLRSWEFAGPLVLLVGAATIGAVYGLLNGGNAATVLGQYKTYLVYLLVLPLSTLFGSLAMKERLERWVVTFCVVSSVIVLIAVALGTEIVTEAPNLPLNTFGMTAEVQRIRPSMLWLLFLGTMIVLGRVYADGLTRGSALRLALFTGVWLFSFNRSSWAALLVCSVVLAVLRPGARRPGRALRVVAVTALVAPVLVAVSYSGALGPSLQQVWPRLASLVDSDVSNEDAVKDRADEYPVAFAAIKESPVFGVGLGRTYGARRPVYDPGLGVIEYRDREFSHNSAVFAYLQTGLLGIVALGWLLVTATRAARQAVRDLPTHVGLRVVVGCVALFGYAIQSMTQTSLLHRPGITAAVIAAVLATRPDEVFRRA